MECILLSHVFIRDTEQHKLETVEFALQHWRQNNQNAYIIVTGHGLQPNIKQYCDHIHWPKTIIEEDINVGHPKLVTVGLNHAIKKGFTKVLKSRADTIHSIKNIIAFCNKHIKDKKLLVTQQTRLDKMEMGDLFVYGDAVIMNKSFNIKNWYPTKTGLTSLAKNFFNLFADNNWHDTCLNHLAFLDIFDLKWIDFRKNWQILKSHTKEMLDNNLKDEYNFYWGAMEKWHVWDKHGNLIYSKPKMGTTTTKKDWK